jgi:hypothetical protein
MKTNAFNNVSFHLPASFVHRLLFLSLARKGM